MTAIYWIYRHLGSTLYIGVEHYRRRLLLGDEEFDEYFDREVDIITSEEIVLDKSIAEKYYELHYGADWELFMEILRKRNPDIAVYAEKVFGSDRFHPGNINVFSSRIFKKVFELEFPILDEFYRRSSEKTDIYQHRDVGFIAERLTHLLVVKMENEGKRIVKVPLKQYSTDEWNVSEVRSYRNLDEIYRVCDELYKANKLKQFSAVVIYSMLKGFKNDEKLRKLSMVINASVKEKEQLP